MKRTAVLRQHGIGLAVVAAMMEGMQRVLPDNRPRLPDPPHIAAMSPRGLRRMENERNRLANRRERNAARKARPPEHTRFAALVNKMTNHERSHWAKAGYPGLHRKDVAALMPHAGAAARRLDGTHLVLGGRP